MLPVYVGEKEAGGEAGRAQVDGVPCQGLCAGSDALHWILNWEKEPSSKSFRNK